MEVPRPLDFAIFLDADKSLDQPWDRRDFITSKSFEFFAQTIPPSPEVI